MIFSLDHIIHTFNDMTPMGIIGLLGYIIFLMINKRGPIMNISNNHLSGLPEMNATLERIEGTLSEIRDGMQYLKGRLNGK